MSDIKYKRVLLNLSGEALAGEQKTGINPEIIGKICVNWQVMFLIENSIIILRYLAHIQMHIFCAH